MIDTIAIRASLPVSSDREEELLRNGMSTWSNRSSRTFHSHTETWHEGISAKHDDSDFRVFVKDGTLIKAEGSLPKVFHGSNGVLIKTPDELDHSRYAFLAQVHHVNATARLEDLKITRIDFSINVPRDPRWMLPLHRFAKHPMIDRETQQYYNAPPKKPRRRPPHRLSELNTVRLHGTKTTVQLYDKVREILGRKSGDWPESTLCTRIEVQLRGGPHIAKLLGFRDRKFITLHELDFRASYLAFRRVLMGFDGNGAVPKFAPNLVSFLALLERHPETWESLGGMSPLDWWAATTKPSARRFRELRKSVGKMTLEFEDFQWEDLLPQDRLPDVVEVGEDGATRMVPSPWSFRIMPGMPGPPCSRR